MNSIDEFEKRLCYETAAVEKEIQSHTQQIEALNKRLEGLKRATELFKSEQAAVAELLQVGTGNGGGIVRPMASPPATKMQQGSSSPKAAVRKQVGRAHQLGRGKTKPARTALATNHNGGLTRADMIAAVLRRHPRRTVRELIALLDREYHWKTTESAVTGHLYTRREKFVHTPPDHHHLVTWSLK
jgi:hypothetical protein